jgi:hypothetical protein
MQPAQLDFEQRINNSFVYFVKLRFDDNSLRSFTGSTIVFHGQSGDTTFHYSSPSSEVTLVDVEGTTDAGIYLRLAPAVTEAWIDGQTFWYQLDEWVSGDRFTLMEGHITASRGVIDGAD